MRHLFLNRARRKEVEMTKYTVEKVDNGFILKVLEPPNKTVEVRVFNSIVELLEWLGTALI